MLGRKKVDFKGTKNGIVLYYANDLSFEELRDQVEKKLSKAKDFFQGAHMIGVDGPALLPDQESSLSQLIERSSGMKVLTLEPFEKNLPKEDGKILISFEQDETLISNQDLLEEQQIQVDAKEHKHEVDAQESSNEEDAQEFPNEADAQESLNHLIGDAALEDKTIFHRGTVRSGARLDSQGHLIVIGDVNPGSELRAKGNIVVLGSLRGFAFAGSGGDDTCVVVALKLQPTQLRIGKWITRPPDEGHHGPNYPEIASVKQQLIIIEPL